METNLSSGRHDLARGARLTAAMVSNGMLYNCQLCYDLGVSESTLSRWRSGRPLSLEHAVALCRRLEITLDYLFTGSTLDGSTFSVQLLELQEIFETLDEGHRILSLGLLRSLSMTHEIDERTLGPELQIGDTSRLSDPWSLKAKRGRSSPGPDVKKPRHPSGER